MRTVISIIALIAFIVVTVDVWRTSLSTGKKVLWTVAAFFFSIITAIVWFVWGKKNASGSRTSLA